MMLSHKITFAAKTEKTVIQVMRINVFVLTWTNPTKHQRDKQLKIAYLADLNFFRLKSNV